MSISKTDAFLFVEKYRPQTIEDCILPVSVKKEISSFISKGEITNMLFSGTAGVGKTSLAKAICNQLDADMLYINMSSQTGIDVVRNQITQFASTASFGGNLKIVLGDECLSEHERIRVGSIDSWIAVPLSSLEKDVPYPIISFNIDTQTFENDIAYIASDREDDLYQVVLDDGSFVVANAKHPFMCVDIDGNIVQRTIEDGFDGYRVIKMSIETYTTHSVKKVTHIGTGRVMNLTVAKNLTFVSENGIVTHNCERLSGNGQDSLKATIEEFHRNTRFIFTTNNVHKIIDPIRSRCTQFDFKISEADKKPMMAQMMKRCVEILKNEGVEYETSAIVALVQKNFPDFRKTLNELQRFSTYGKIDTSILVQDASSFEDLTTAMKEKKFVDVRKWVAKNGDMDSATLFRYFYEHLSELFVGKSIPDVILILAQYQHYATMVVDQEINNIACIVEIMGVAQWK